MSQRTPVNTCGTMKGHTKSHTLNSTSDDEAVEVRRRLQKCLRKQRVRHSESLRQCTCHRQTVGEEKGRHSIRSVNAREVENRQLSPRMIVGQGRTDPFNALPVKNVPPVVHKIIDYGRFCALHV